MTFSVPHRSASGCLTCKQRRKKCDETKPFCMRCSNGYHLPKASSSRNRHTDDDRPALTVGPRRPNPGENPHHAQSEGPYYNTYGSSDKQTDFGKQTLDNASGLQQANGTAKLVPRGISLDPATFSDMVPLILSQYKRFEYRLFRPFPTEYGLTQRITSSEITRWTMYIQAKAVQAIWDGNQWEHFIGWIHRFHRQIIGSPVTPQLTISELCDRLSGLHDLYTCAYMISNTRIGYSLFKKCTPLVLQLAARYPDMWSQDSRISLARALCAPRFDTTSFFFFDTICALVLGTLPLVQYDTAYPTEPLGTKYLEWVYGCPAHIIVLLAQINAWRTTEWLGQANLEADTCREAEEVLRGWNPRVELEDELGGESLKCVGRFAIQESWRHAVFIYLYMGRCGVNSADSRVQASVRQIVQLVNSVGPETQLGLHISVPCLVAGAAARQEKHRAMLLEKVRGSDKQNVWVLRGADFALVLDHLWRGAGADGRPTTWDDYVNSRWAALPLDAELADGL